MVLISPELRESSGLPSRSSTKKRSERSYIRETLNGTNAPCLSGNSSHLLRVTCRALWERLIRSVRKCMKGLLGNPNAPLALETLRTVFYEAASILNSRPLSPSSDDPNDLEPLTPNHFLLLRSNATPPPGVFTENDLYSRKHWRHAQYLTNHFWKRWKKEYVPLLQQRHKWTSVKRNLKVDDLVLITDSVEPRSKWLLGRVTRVNVGRDNHVRSAEVRTKSSVLVRPVTKLCLLEESA